METRIRIQKIVIENIKNVAHGEIRFACNICDDIFEEKSDILGLYGQNGSGKTTLIFVLDVLRRLTEGKRLWKDVDKYIRLGTSEARISYEFSVVTQSEKKFYVKYEVTIKKQIKENDLLNDESHLSDTTVFVEKEKLSYKRVDGSKGNRFIGIIDYNYHYETVFEPNMRYKEFIQKDKLLVDELRYNKEVSYKEGTSFIFTLGKIDKIRERQGFEEELVLIMDAIQMFGIAKLFVLSNVQASIVNANIVLPMTFRFWKEEQRSFKIITAQIKLTDETLVFQEIYDLMVNRFKLIDKVISKLIPDMSLQIVNKGNKIDENQKSYVIAEIISVRSGKNIPLRYESDGIKKLVYVLYSLVEMYNDASVTVAIDELDSGVFEYLLGEILCVLQESAKGQLIFTSHNLRPLEVLNKKNVMFSTINACNRYIRFKNVKGTNNLRDLYYQHILLGGQDEGVYESTSQNEIRRAFRSAGGDLND